MPDIDNGSDSQDGAEAFDETNREDELTLGGDDAVEDPDVARDVYDVTSALGDADDDHYALDAADAGPDDLDADDLKIDDDDDDDLDDDFEDDPEDDDLDEADDPVDAAAGLARADEPGLRYVADVDLVTRPRDDEVEKYESTRPLSDARLTELGYRRAASRDAPRERPSFVESDDGTAIHGTGATADDVVDEADAAEDARLDEGLEETFPASDPVSAKHIT